MSLLSKLFGTGGGGGAGARPEPEIYKDFSIFPEPQRAEGGYRIAARIEKEVAGEVRVHQLVRADVIAGEEDAVKASIGKAKQMIDEQGEAIF